MSDTISNVRVLRTWQWV